MYAAINRNEHRTGRAFLRGTVFRENLPGNLRGQDTGKRVCELHDLATRSFESFVFHRPRNRWNVLLLHVALGTNRQMNRCRSTVSCMIDVKGTSREGGSDGRNCYDSRKKACCVFDTFGFGRIVMISCAWMWFEDVEGRYVACMIYLIDYASNQRRGCRFISIYIWFWASDGGRGEELL